MYHWTILIYVLLTNSITASSLRILETVKELEETGFGRPPPRHGYVLLVWYVQVCIDNNMMSLCNPAAGEYGFHVFQNRGPKPLLPKLDRLGGCKYYTVGNLHSKHAEDLPYEVRMYYDKHDRRSNQDRMLVKYLTNKNYIEEIYASAHYNQSQTYLISPSLIRALRNQQADQPFMQLPYQHQYPLSRLK